MGHSVPRERHGAHRAAPEPVLDVYYYVPPRRTGPEPRSPEAPDGSGAAADDRRARDTASTTPVVSVIAAVLVVLAVIAVIVVAVIVGQLLFVLAGAAAGTSVLLARSGVKRWTQHG